MLTARIFSGCVSRIIKVKKPEFTSVDETNKMPQHEPNEDIVGRAICFLCSKFLE